MSYIQKLLNVKAELHQQSDKFSIIVSFQTARKIKLLLVFPLMQFDP